MTYQECIDYLYNQLPVFHRVGSPAYKKGLNNIWALSEALGNPHQQFKTIHIAGTNGKGSSSNMLAAILQSAGYKTGLYTSPHLKEFTERIKINGVDLPAPYLINFVQQHKDLFAQIQPSFFEMTVALAFQYFAEEQIDIAVIEVGLGGRLDSTNIITPLVSLITNISLDHQNLLGDSLVSIAQEKAGIIKPGVPVVISKTQPEVAPVFEEVAATQNAELFFADQLYKVRPIQNNIANQVFEVSKEEEVLWPTLELALGGAYQQYNLPGVLQVVDILQQKSFTINKSAIQQGLEQVNSLTGFKGRWQVLGKDPLVICDTGHNEDGIRQILKQLDSLPVQQVHLVFGMVKDKDVTKILQLLPSQYRYYFCQASIPRALPAYELQSLAAIYNLRGEVYSNVNEAFGAARQQATPEDVIFIGGSTFIVAELEEL